ncbi:hypothetical protein [Bifidobacterium oedipodis]|uniref:Uncharacterized protein n=1 Tax=Bifidobacterium oedipodis TaxID=2675322 RepID=A0A7Y0EPZ8_9BIFI|nr:hypothetical protein [Bifidobacterium sp. DSM 109957]NMM94319.1 hypothetical protein [Bifidobacterium sp. DSM 109957]
MAGKTRLSDGAGSSGFGLLSFFWQDMKPRGGGKRKSKTESQFQLFTERRVWLYLAAVATISIVNLFAQAAWVVASHNIGWDPWWLGMLGIDSSRFDVLGLLASLIGLSAAWGLGIALLGCFISHVKWVFLAGMVMMIAGASRMLGTGLGRLILLAQIDKGMIPVDSFVDYYRSGPAELTSGTSVPAIAIMAGAAVIFAGLMLLKALAWPSDAVPRVSLGASAAITLGLFGVVFIESGFAPVRMLTLLIAVLVGLVVLPGEVAQVRYCAIKQVSAQWCWHPALIIWLETLLAMALPLVAALDI